MRTPAMIALAAAAGFAAAWLLATHLQKPVAAPAPPAPIAQPAVAPPPPPAAEPDADRPPPPPPQHEPPQEPAPAPEPAKPAVEPPKPAETPAPEEAEPEDAAEDEAPGKPPIDTDHAADLLADLIAQQEAEDPTGLPNSTAETWKKFDQETADPEWSDKSSKQLEEALQQWIDALPDDIRDHIAIVHVECRTTLCQILAADNDEDTQNQRSQSGQEWQVAISTLPSQPWWSELGFINMFTQVSSKDGTLLYISYLLREAKPPA